MKNLIFIILCSLYLYSCDIISCCTEDNRIVEFVYTDSLGNNILGYENGIDTTKIKVFYKKDTEWQEFYDVRYEASRSFFIYEEDDERFLVLFPSNIYSSEDMSETKIQFSDDEFDIVKCQFDIDRNSIVCTKVWYNGDLKWEGNGQNQRKIKIIK